MLANVLAEKEKTLERISVEIINRRTTSYLFPLMMKLRSTIDQLYGTANVSVVETEMQRSAPSKRLHIRICPVKQKRVESLLVCLEFTKLIIVTEKMQWCLVSFVRNIWVGSLLEE